MGGRHPEDCRRLTNDRMPVGGEGSLEELRLGGGKEKGKEEKGAGRRKTNDRKRKVIEDTDCDNDITCESLMIKSMEEQNTLKTIENIKINQEDTSIFIDKNIYNETGMVKSMVERFEIFERDNPRKLRLTPA